MKTDDKIYVAGGQSGLVGRAIVRNLTKKGYNNIIIKSRQELNLLDISAVENFFRTERPDYVFLAAAKVGGIMANTTRKAEFIFENLEVQSHVIYQSWKYKAKKLLFLGSSCIYPRMAPQPIKEQYLLTGPLEETNDAYAIAKIAGIKMCQSFNQQYKTNFISVMPTNLYGPYDNFDLQSSHVLPAILRKFHDAKINNLPQVTLWGTGSAYREFMHVDDMADACVHLMKTYNGSDIVNIGTGSDISIRELAFLVKEIVQYQGDICWDSKKPDGTPKKQLDVSMLNNLGWKASISLKKGIRQTYQWFLKQHDDT